MTGGLAVVAAGHCHGAGVRVEEDLRGVEPHPARRVPRPFDAVAVGLAGRHAGDEGVPVVVGAVGDRVEADGPSGRRVVDAVEQQQLDPGGVPREEAEVGPVAAGRGPERRAGARPGHVRPYVTGQGFACQISVAYSAIVRSLENVPVLAMLRIALRAQPSWSA